MASNEPYMLPRDAQESARLDKQHKFQREIVGGHLIHPSIPKHKLRAFADVGTGTGIWLRELAQEHDAVAGKETTYVGFDISTQQFPKETPKGIDFVVHDVCEPFPDKYHGSFDLVHVRFLSFALKAQYLGETISNIVKILKPGGYLQWTELDANDFHPLQPVPHAKAMKAWIINERIAMGLTPSFTPTLIYLLTVLDDDSAPEGTMCPLTASDDLLRILSVQTLSTKDHASPSLRASIHTETAAAGAGLLREGIARRKQMLSEMSDAGSEPEKQEVEREIEQLTTWLSEYDASGYKAKTEWSICYTQIVARKAFWMGKDEDWETEATWG